VDPSSWVCIDSEQLAGRGGADEKIIVIDIRHTVIYRIQRMKKKFFNFVKRALFW
jgi:hypothetical protein